MEVANKSKQACDALQKCYQGGTKVFTVKLQTLRHNFENSFMHDGESLDDYYTKLAKAINQMQKLW